MPTYPTHRMEPVSVYARTLAVGLARVWENVLDWEHLPWLHRDTFGHVRLLERRADGWRAETSLRGRDAAFVVDVAIDRTARTYHSRTVAGPGTGSDIVTTLTPVDERTTRVDVAFLVPDVAPEHAAQLGAAYVALYTRLWDEDEAMMLRRQELLDGLLAGDGCTIGTAKGRRFRAVCPHLGGPLDDLVPDADGCVVCPWHGYRFDLHTGRSADGRGLALEPA